MKLNQILIITSLIILIIGGFSPLKGFMLKADYESVVESHRTKAGFLFGLPIVMDTDREDLVPGENVLLSYKGQDLAVLKIEDMKQRIEALVSIEIGNSKNLLVGEWAIAIGHPFATSVGNPKPTVTVGVVSAKDRSLETNKQRHRNLIQTDASINKGNPSL